LPPPDALFSALADPTRRAILDLLRDRQTRTAGQIAARFPTISRPAVSKHLRVLRGADLVRAEERGRERHYVIDARPLGQLQREWLDRFAPLWEDSLRRLKHQAEQPAGD
jgi:DNA-binding transcriptional ArsR family regulator